MHGGKWEGLNIGAMLKESDFCLPTSSYLLIDISSCNTVDQPARPLVQWVPDRPCGHIIAVSFVCHRWKPYDRYQEQPEHGRGWQGMAVRTLTFCLCLVWGLTSSLFRIIFELFLARIPPSTFPRFLASRPHPTKQPAKIKAGSRGWRAGVGHRQAEMHFS
jgi:hypothetical protein